MGRAALYRKNGIDSLLFWLKLLDLYVHLASVPWPETQVHPLAEFSFRDLHFPFSPLPSYVG